jgi:hypothetical protein
MEDGAVSASILAFASRSPRWVRFKNAMLRARALDGTDVARAASRALGRNRNEQTGTGKCPGVPLDNASIGEVKHMFHGSMILLYGANYNAGRTVRRERGRIVDFSGTPDGFDDAIRGSSSRPGEGWMTSR